MKKYILYAGVNGSGKSTLYHSSEKYLDLPRINTDEIVRKIGNWREPSDIARAGKIAVREIKRLFSEEKSFTQETTLCGKSILRNIRKAKDLGYEVEMHYVGLESVELAKARIAKRVASGGHDIPGHDVERRYLESFQNLIAVINICDTIMIYDNTLMIKNIAMISKGIIMKTCEDVPEWCKRLFKENITN